MAIRHMGIIKNTGSRVIVVYRSLPDAPDSCLVIYKDSLPDVYVNKVVSFTEGTGQQSIDLYDVMHKAGILEGRNMLSTLHNTGLLKMVKTSDVVMHPGGNQTVRLDELNSIIQDELLISEGTVKSFNPFDMGSAESTSLEDRGLVERLMQQYKHHTQEANSFLQRAIELDPSIKVPDNAVHDDSVLNVKIPIGVPQSKAIELVRKALKEYNDNKEKK